MKKAARSNKKTRPVSRVFFVFAVLISSFSLLLATSVFAYMSPGKPVGLVNDFARVLTASESQTIETKLVSLSQTTGVELAVVTIPTIGTDETVESYSEKLFKEWGIGDKEKDTGILLLVAINDRQMRIETGYGIEGAVTDIQAGNIIRNVMTPAFKEGKYGQGISGAVDALTAIISGSPEAAQYSVEPRSFSGGSDFLKAFKSFGAIVILLVLNIVLKVLGRTKSWWLGGVLGAAIGIAVGYFAHSLIGGILLTVILGIGGLIVDYMVSKLPPGSGGGGYWPIFFGRGGGGFGGGGFGGFGGGSSGGGGASGRW